MILRIHVPLNLDIILDHRTYKDRKEAKIQNMPLSSLQSIPKQIQLVPKILKTSNFSGLFYI
jgi:hypothetical protein